MNRASAFVRALPIVAVLVCPVAAAAQSNFIPPAEANPQAAAGWTLTPSLTYSGAWDDNVLLRGDGDVPATDFVSVVNPRAAVDFNGRRGQLSASYDGSFLLYRELSTLNSYDQRGSIYAGRMITPHLGVFVRGFAAQVPTTELVAFAGLPFIRNGSRILDTHAGVNASLTKRTSLSVTYDIQLVGFDHSAVGAEPLRSGHSQGASVAFRHAIDPRLTFTADYQLTHANTHPIIGAAGPIDRAFDIQNGWAGADYRLSEETHVFAAGGISRLGVTELSEPRTGPAWRAGLVRNFRSTVVDAEYSRSFVPAYGFGGTTQNEELTARVRVPLARRIYTTGSISRRRNDPLILTIVQPPLRSLWVEAMVGYAATPSLNVQGFYGGTHQTIDRPGGETDRTRIGFQVTTTTKPMRVR
jgi:hypothetical protein